MTRAMLPVLPVFICLALAVPSPAQAQSRNAATWYRRAADKLVHFSDEDQDVIVACHDTSGLEVPKGLRPILSRATLLLADFQRGSRCQFCNFDLPYEDGIAMLIPHLSQVRALARFTYARGYVDLADNDTSSATERIATLYRAAVHCGDDRLIISSLVGSSILKLADKLADLAFDQQLLSRDNAGRLFSTLRRQRGIDALRYTDAIAMEGELVSRWVRVFLAEEISREEGEEFLLSMGMEGLAHLNSDDIDDEVAGFDRFMVEVNHAFMMEDPDEALAYLELREHELLSGDYGSVARVLAAQFQKIYDAMHMSMQLIEDRCAMLEDIMHGLYEADAGGNAAPYYLQAARLLREAERIPGEGEVASRERTQRRDAARANIAEGARQRSFSLNQPGIRLHSGTNFHRPELTALDEVAAFVMETFEAACIPGAAPEAERWLGILYCMIGHLGTDDWLLSAILAHHWFDEATIMFENLVVMVTADPIPISRVKEAVQRIGLGDPFGYGRSLAVTRRGLARLLHVPDDDTGSGDTVAASQVIRGWTPGQVLAGHAVVTALRTMRRAEAGGKVTTVPSPDLSQLDGVLDTGYIDGLYRDAHDLEDTWNTSDWRFPPGSITRLPVGERIRACRSDLRKLMVHIEDLGYQDP